MADNVYEIKDYRGQSYFRKLLRCIQCEKLVSDTQFMGADVCRRCIAREQHEWSRQSKERIGRENHLRRLASPNKRWAKFVMATPAWRDRDKIKEIYAEAKRKTAETGIEHHVDHYYPIQGRLCCGLHVHENLRVITASANYSKHAGHPTGESPALEAFVKQYGLEGLRKWINWAEDGLK